MCSVSVFTFQSVTVPPDLVKLLVREIHLNIVRNLMGDTNT